MTKFDQHDPDATIVLPRAGKSPEKSPGKLPGKRNSSRRIWLALAIAAATLGVVVLWVLLRPPESASLPSSAYAPLASESELLATPADHVSLWRFDAAPLIWVMIFPTLHEQALTLDRVAEFVERAGGPRDRLLDDADLRAAIKATGDDFDTVYYGHDYRAADLRRFFADAAAEHIALDAQELSLEAQLRAQGLLAPGAPGALITMPPPGTGMLDSAARATILRHELSHGLYFTDATYNAYVHHFWTNDMTDAERSGMRSFLIGEGYDANNEDLIENESLAYLIHTRDPRFFTAAAVGMTNAELESLRQNFVGSMPPSWLRDRTTP